MKKIMSLIIAVSVATAMTSCAGSGAKTAETEALADSLTDSVATVYFIKEISPESLMKIYDALGRKAEGRVAVKLSTGEAGNRNHLSPELIKCLVDTVHGTIVECNTAYAGKRMKTEDHLKVAADHGFTAIAPFSILDAEGDTIIPATGKHLSKDIVGKDFLNYDFLMVLSHFKGHQMAGFGGAMKNISIGLASTDGKAYIHSAGKTTVPDSMWANLPVDSIFQESMAEASKAIIDHIGPQNALYINVANNLSIDCDCNGNPAPAEMADLGIFASLDPVAVDRACLDAVRNSPDHGKQHLLERIEARKAPHNLDYAEQIGAGTQKYRLVEIK